MTNYYENCIVEPVRACPDLEELGNEELGNWHTMGTKLLPYVSSKFTEHQVRFIEKCLRENTPIQVHGVFEEHLTDCLRKHGLRQRLFENGHLRLDRKHKSAGNKHFNFERPFFVNTVDENGNPVAILVTFPSREYVCQTAELLFAFVKLNLQLILWDGSRSDLGPIEDVEPRFEFEAEEANTLLANFLSGAQIRQYRYPEALETFPSWSGLEQATESGLIL